MEGRMEGRSEGARETAKNMLSKGFAMEIAAECTGLPIAEIKAIAESMKH
jgi:predicted transposase/invertase (TIGR01784 family)